MDDSLEMVLGFHAFLITQFGRQLVFQEMFQFFKLEEYPDRR